LLGVLIPGRANLAFSDSYSWQKTDKSEDEMPLTFWFDIAASGFGVAMAALVLIKEPNSLAHRLFSVMMLLLAVESLFAALGVGAGFREGAVFWQRIEFIPRSFWPGRRFFSAWFTHGEIITSFFRNGGPSWVTFSWSPFFC